MVIFIRTLVAREGLLQHLLLPEGSRSTQSGEMRFVFWSRTNWVQPFPGVASEAKISLPCRSMLCWLTKESLCQRQGTSRTSSQMCTGGFCHPCRLNVVIFKLCAIWILLLLSPNEINFSKVTALQSAQGRGTATVQQIGGGGDSVILGERSS